MTQLSFLSRALPPTPGDGQPGSPLEVHREEKRRMSNKAKVLARLQQGPATTKELIVAGGTRAPGRVWELKKYDGYDIHVDERGGGLVVYTLRGRK